MHLTSMNQYGKGALENETIENGLMVWNEYLTKLI
jgi:hypothetical protein